MANNPTRVTLLDENQAEIFSVTESHPESLNDRGSERTRFIRIEGPVNCVVTCFDDQQFRMGENSVKITKIVPDPIVVPIAQNFVQGQQRNGVFFGSTATYKWQLNKAILREFWQYALGGIWDATKLFFNEGINGNKNPELARSYQSISLPGFIDGFVSTLDGSTSDNNHVDDLSSIKFGD